MLRFTQNSAALVFGSGSFPSNTSRVNRKKNSAAFEGSKRSRVTGRLFKRRVTKSIPFCESSGSAS